MNRSNGSLAYRNHDRAGVPEGSSSAEEMVNAIGMNCVQCERTALNHYDD